MKAIVYESYGSADQLELKEVAKPEIKANEVLIRVKAVSLNASDMEMLTANPSYVRMWGLFKPKFNILGSDIAGIVEAIGKDVKSLQIGDEVFGDAFEKWGGLAEFVSLPEEILLKKPAFLSFEEAAAIPQSAVVALQAIRYKRSIKEGEHILINGAGGGAGSFAIQLAKFMGAEITAVDNSSKLEMMRDLGAGHVVDYKREDFTKKGILYDRIIDFVAHTSIWQHKSALKENGIYALVGGSIGNLLKTLFGGFLIGLSSKKKMGIVAHKQNLEDIGEIVNLIKVGKIKVIIDRCFEMDRSKEAFEYLIGGKAKGKVVIKV